MAEFVFGRLILEPEVREWKRISERWLQALPFPVGMDHFNLRQYISNGYLVSRNLLEAAQSNKQELIKIGKNRPDRTSKGGAPPRSGDSGKTSRDSQPLAGKADIGTSKSAARGARRTPQEDDDAAWAPCGGAHAAAPPRPSAGLRCCLSNHILHDWLFLQTAFESVYFWYFADTK